MVDFNGETFEPELDGDRLSRQFDRVKALMLDGEWRTLGDIQNLTSFPQASISARLRDLRKPRFGSHTVERKRIDKGLFAYRVLKPAEIVQRLPPQTDSSVNGTSIVQKQCIDDLSQKKQTLDELFWK